MSIFYIGLNSELRFKDDDQAREFAKRISNYLDMQFDCRTEVKSITKRVGKLETKEIELNKP